jgi:hypothetical protein
MDHEGFLNRVYPEPNTGCWIWSGRVGRDGYGEIHPSKNHPEKNISFLRAHRYSYHFYNGPFDDERLVLHKCDVRCCVNPNHLYLGDQAQNVRDMDDRRRRKTPKGTETKASKINESIALDIFKECASGKYFDREIAVIFSVDRGVVNRIKNRKSWTHVTKHL